MPANQNRPKRKRGLAILAVVLAAPVLAGAVGITLLMSQRKPATGRSVSFAHGGRERRYRIHVPASYTGKSRVPIVFCFHGGGGTADVASRMGFSPIADKEGFIVVYPEGLNKHWNDGRESKKFAKQDAEVDDVAFVLALLKKLRRDYRLDSNRVYAAGASNGGFFSHRLAIDAAEHFAAAAIMIATMPIPLDKQFSPDRPVSMLFMNGTKDPFVPYEGGPITPNFTPRLVDSKTYDFGRGACSSTDAAVQKWLDFNGLDQKQPRLTRLKDQDPRDGCRVERRVWTGGKAGVEVVLYRIEGGGHTIPGGVQYLPERLIGKTCQDFDGLNTIWQFFQRCRR